MGLYSNVILPRLCDLAMRNPWLVPYRQRVIAMAEGYVLEVGIGSGLNLPFYSPQVRHILGVEPAARLIAMARRAADSSSTPVTFVEGTAEAIPLENDSVDTVVTTWTLCTIPKVREALGEMHRVLKPGGRLLFVEHGRAPEASVARWQDRLTPLWRRIAGGCHLNRPIDTLITESGFQLERLERGYMRGPKVMAFIFEGAARPGSKCPG